MKLGNNFRALSRMCTYTYILNKISNAHYVNRTTIKTRALVIKSVYIVITTNETYTLQELSVTFITPETLDEAIDRALGNMQDYNYAIDLQGNKYVGRDTSITPTKEKEAASSKH